MAASASRRSVAYCLEYPRRINLRRLACSVPSLPTTERAAPKRALKLSQNSNVRKCRMPSRIMKRLASTPASTVKRRCSMRTPNTGPSSRYCAVRNRRMSFAMLKVLPRTGKPRETGGAETAISLSSRLRRVLVQLNFPEDIFPIFLDLTLHRLSRSTKGLSWSVTHRTGQICGVRPAWWDSQTWIGLRFYFSSGMQLGENWQRQAGAAFPTLGLNPRPLAPSVLHQQNSLRDHRTSIRLKPEPDFFCYQRRRCCGNS